MEPLELGIVGTWLWKNGDEKLTRDMLESVLPHVKDTALKLPGTVQEKLRNIGAQLRGAASRVACRVDYLWVK
ncbi:MAG: hypothetical protein GDA44_04540 [Prochloron sp. SP5CPC1]|nr:hypothetical protein [Candidatus Paraprochloron terpiosi SP5CPC1]